MSVSVCLYGTVCVCLRGGVVSFTREHQVPYPDSNLDHKPHGGKVDLNPECPHV